MELWKKNHSFAAIGLNPNNSYHALGLSTLLQEMMAKSEGHVNDFSAEGFIKESDDKGKSFFEEILKEGGRLAYKMAGEQSDYRIYLFEDGLVTLTVNNGNYIDLNGLLFDEEKAQRLYKLFNDKLLPAVQEGHIFAIIRQGNYLGLNTIGDASIALERGNYTKKVLEVYDAAIKDLNSRDPAGRIAILEGEPGTGKTHMIRAFLKEVPDAMFVLISPDMVSSLSGPELLPVLLTNKNNYQMNGPIVLVLEDADRCLVRREGDNISEIQALLNLGDGILGSLLDLRIICTTNAKKLEMEPALLRPGRLSQRMEVGPLDFQTARDVFHRLLPEAQFPEKLTVDNQHSPLKMTLAEVYSLARKAGWEPTPREVKPLVGGLGKEEGNW